MAVELGTGRIIRRRPVLAALCAVLVGAAILVPASVFAVGDTLPAHAGRPDRDFRTGNVAPTAAQLTSVANLGATATWNRFGTVSTLVRPGGYLQSGLTGLSPEAAARRWISANKALFRLTSSSGANLQVVSVNRVRKTQAYAVLFRQVFGAYQPSGDGLIVVGISGSAGNGWNVAYAGSSSLGTQAAPAPATLNAKSAWQRAAAHIGRSVALSDIAGAGTDGPWQLFRVEGFAQPGRTRQVAVGIPGGGVRVAYEAIVLDAAGASADAFTIHIDARSGAVLSRVNNEQQLAQETPAPEAPQILNAPSAGAFNGTYVPPTTCGPDHEFEAPAGSKSIVVVASALVGTNDIVLNLVYKEGTPAIVASSDTGTSPEAVTYSPTGGVPAGTYAARVCPFDPPTVPAVPPFTYAGTYAVNDAASPTFPFPPKWKYFRANPALNSGDVDLRRVGCWGAGFPGCDFNVRSDASRSPWDHIVNTNSPSFTTIGNNAIAGEAWLSPLTPAEQYRPSSATREYIYPWTDQWNNTECSTAVFASPERNDINAATAGLFAQHNRMHDWSYFLGFTETAFNLQVNNFGNTSPDRENDPEIGNSQAGAISGGPPTYLGRDNANQITLNDGIAPITNMYLWQPIAAGFYAPCSDGDYDMSVIAHEYGHAIQNRMAAGPDAGLTGAQARSMGESWSDLTAIEYLAEYGYYGDLASTPTAGLNPFAVGPYVTGSVQKGIRNYGMNASPLNYSDLEYDPNGVSSPHADGEIWSAVNFDIRQALMAKYNGSFPSGDANLQRRCADGEIPADLCPGNRRWVQIFHTGFLLLASGAASMVDARNAYLGADSLLFGGANTADLQKAFAKRGLGKNASSNTVEDLNPQISFESASLTNAQHATIRFRAKQYANEGDAFLTNAKVYVGRYEARAVPIADTDPATSLSDVARFVPGTYEFTVVAPGYGHFRFTRQLTASATTIALRVTLPRNWASLSSGGDATAVSTTDDGINRSRLIDDTETSNWASLNNATGVNGQQITVDLGGGSRLVGRVRVSAFLRPQNTEDPGDPEDAVGDTDPQSRVAARWRFQIQTCTASAANLNCTADLGFTTIYTSPTDAFPGSVPRPLAPDLQIREFDVPDTFATHTRLRVLTNQCSGGPAYAGEQDNDPLNVTDCQLGSTQDEDVRAAELQVISAPGATAAFEDPVVVLEMTGPATAARGTSVSYPVTYTNLGPAPSSNATLRAFLPPGVTYASSTNGGVYNAQARTVTWSLGTVPVGVTGSRSVTVSIPLTTAAGTILLTRSEFTAPLTVANPAAVATTVL